MGKHLYISLLLLFSTVSLKGQDSIRISGQLSSWINANSSSDFPLHGGVRYIPQLNYSIGRDVKKLFDSELSANLFVSAALHPFDSLITDGNIKPYRAWVRYSSEQFEVRLGLQKLNFGSASMLRPLMWFDQMDQRDPLQLTDGVWGLLARYYFINNTNIWLWGLFGNNGRRGWETIPVNRKIPEFGGRLQVPVPGGEAAVSFHHRVADSRGLGGSITPYEKIPEYKIGLDAKWDFLAGIWIEGSFTHKGKEVGMLTNQFVFNAGIDYTFNAGNGIYAAFEQLIATYDEDPFAFSNKTTFSLMTVRYPLGLFDNLSAIIYYNWSENDIYSFVNWQRQFDNTVIYLMAYWNPETYQFPLESGSQYLFAGKGIQLMFIFNH
mgnify:CR=1 FL=1